MCLFFCIILAKLEVIVEKLHKHDIMFDRLSAFGTQLCNILGQKLVICNLSKILDIDNIKTTWKKNKMRLYIVIKF